MKIAKRIFQIILILIVVMIIGVFLFLNHIRNRAVPDYNDEIDLDNLTEEVTVYRDSLAIPHIYAKNEPDLYRAIGYVMAQDRLWQMDLLRRITSGRLSEILGEDLIGADHLFRALNLPAKSRKLIELTDPELLNIYEAFSDGVNQFIEKNNKNLSFEFSLLGYKPEPWEVIDLVNLIGYLAWDLNSGWVEDMDIYKISQVVDDTLVKELIPDMIYQNTPIFPEFMSGNPDLEIVLNINEVIKVINDYGLEGFNASNNWAISGSKSETGMPLLSNDTHQKLMSPGIWYQMHHVIEGELNVTGTVLPGIPFVVLGHNEDIAWGMTNVYVDNVDFYLETINPENENQYLLDGEWKDMKLIEEEILVKDSDPIIKTIKSTHRGPVISTIKGINDKVISVRWAGFDPLNDLMTPYLLNRAENWDEFREACSFFKLGNQNIVYADKFGNIGLQTAAGLPIREGNPILIYPGDTSLYDWKGFVPFEELPYSFNPENGYVSSANNRTVDENYPYYIGTWFSMSHRIDRIRDMLEEKEILGTDDFKRMQADFVSYFARNMVPVYSEVLCEVLDGNYKIAADLLSEWDYDMTAESAEALIFDILYIELTRSIFGDELDDDLLKILYKDNIFVRNFFNKIRITGESAWCDNVLTADVKETFHDNIRSAFYTTIDTLTLWYGEDISAWKWGDLHTVSLDHPMGSVDIVNKLFKVNKGPYPIGGSFHTVSVYKYPISESFNANHGSSKRHIFNTADWDASLTIIPTGTSGVPASPHYLDQTEMYINNKFHADHFTKEAVMKNALYKTVFK